MHYSSHLPATKCWLLLLVGLAGFCRSTPAQVASPGPTGTLAGTSFSGKSSLTVFGGPVLAATSPNWTDINTGVGMDAGLTGGFHYQYGIARWLAVGAQLGYTQWQVQRRFFEQQTERFSSSQAMQQLALLATIRAYTFRNVYLQPTGGGQFIRLSHTYSSDYPGQDGPRVSQVFRPSVGGAIGYELHHKWLLADVSVTYQVLLNQRLQSLNGPLRYVGLRLGIGWQQR